MNTKYKAFQRTLRTTMPDPEVILWTYIRKNQLGIKFRRQYAIEDRILDFYAPSIKLGIEVDGETHFLHEHQYDGEKTEDLRLNHRYGVTVLRFLNSDVRRNLDGVLLVLNETITRLENPPPNLPL